MGIIINKMVHKISRYTQWIFALVLVLWPCGCIDEIVFDTPNQGGVLIIDGTITNGEQRHTITVARTSPSDGIPIMVTGANVWIEDDQGNREKLIENYTIPANPDLYLSLPTVIEGYTLLGEIVKGQIGVTYTLEVTLNNGSFYRSKPDTMPSVLADDTARFEIGKEEELSSGGILQQISKAQVYLNSNIPAEPLYLKWDLAHVFSFRQTPIPYPGGFIDKFCFVTEYPNAQSFQLLNNSSGIAREIKDQKLGSKTISNDFSFTNVFNVVQISLSRDAFKYWERIKQVVLNTGTIFDVPGATPVGNISNVENPNEKVLGFFSAAAQDTSRIFLSKTDIPSRLRNIRNQCPNNWTRNLSSSCEDCRTIRNSTENKPSYWPN